MICLVAVSESEQVPSDVDKGWAAEEHDCVKRQLHDEEETGVEGVLGELLAGAVAEEQGSEGSQPENEDAHALLKDLVKSSHFLFNYLLF